jgi:hypothetical protein
MVLTVIEVTADTWRLALSSFAVKFYNEVCLRYVYGSHPIALTAK